MVEKEELNAEKPMREIQPPARGELSKNEKYKIINEIFNVFSKNNLSIKQAKEIMGETTDALEHIYPWNKNKY